MTDFWESKSVRLFFLVQLATPERGSNITNKDANVPLPKKKVT